MNKENTKAIYFISVASDLSGIHPQTIRTYEEKGLIDRKSTRLNSSHSQQSRMPSSA